MGLSPGFQKKDEGKTEGEVTPEENKPRRKLLGDVKRGKDWTESSATPSEKLKHIVFMHNKTINVAWLYVTTDDRVMTFIPALESILLVNPSKHFMLPYVAPIHNNRAWTRWYAKTFFCPVKEISFCFLFFFFFKEQNIIKYFCNCVYLWKNAESKHHVTWEERSGHGTSYTWQAAASSCMHRRREKKYSFHARKPALLLINSHEKDENNNKNYEGVITWKIHMNKIRSSLGLVDSG